jgi:hypothetical protein
MTASTAIYLNKFSSLSIPTSAEGLKCERLFAV